MIIMMSEFGGLRKHEKTQHALKIGGIISLLICGHNMEEEEQQQGGQAI